MVGILTVMSVHPIPCHSCSRNLRVRTHHAASLVSFTKGFFLLACCLSLTACFDLREELWVKSDGSGRVEITCDLPATAARMQGGDAAVRKKIALFLLGAPALKSPSCEVRTVGESTRVHIDVSFDSAMDLKQLGSRTALKGLPSGATYLAGEIRADVHGRTMDFTRTLTPSKALPGIGFLPVSELERHRLVYVMHLPVAVVDSNATSVLDGGCTMVWDVSLADALKGPVCLHFRAPIPMPWVLVATVTLGLSTACCGLGWVKHRRSRRLLHGPENPGECQSSE